LERADVPWNTVFHTEASAQTDRLGKTSADGGRFEAAAPGITAVAGQAGGRRGRGNSGLPENIQSQEPTDMASEKPTSVEPFIPATTHLPELTPRALVLGTILGMIFGASSLYLVLKVGLTVSASIPVAVTPRSSRTTSRRRLVPPENQSPLALVSPCRPS
jgi:hypothetical protein